MRTKFVGSCTNTLAEPAKYIARFFLKCTKRAIAQNKTDMFRNKLATRLWFQRIFARQVNHLEREKEVARVSFELWTQVTVHDVFICERVQLQKLTDLLDQCDIVNTFHVDSQNLARCL